MAVSEIEQKILGRIAEETANVNPLLSSVLFQILGLSIQLSKRLFRAQKLRKLDMSRDTKSASLYHHIIWLAREGLTITEVLILPYSQSSRQNPHLRVMAAKLRASFYRDLCLFHNSPPVNQLSPRRVSPISPGQQVTESRTQRAAFRETIPSMTSETSYVTNPFPSEGPAQSPPPTYPLPPIPSGILGGHATPIRPPGLNIPSPAKRSPPSSAEFLFPPENFVPRTANYFNIASTLARQLLPGSDPLRLAVALEQCTFTWDCGKDYKAAKELGRAAIKDVYGARESMDDADFLDSAALVRSIAVIVKRKETVSLSSQSPEGQLNPDQKTSEDNAVRPRVSPPSVQSRSITPRTRARRKAAPTVVRTAPSNSRSPEEGESASGAAANTGPLVGSSKQDRSVTEQMPTNTDAAKRGRASSQTQRRRESPASRESEKERKRRILERAEEEVRRRNSVRSPSSGGSRQATPPQLVGVGNTQRRRPSKNPAAV